MVALFVIAAFTFGFFVRDQTAGLTAADLTPSRIRACDDQAVGHAIALNLIAAEDFDPELRAALGDLSAVCDQDEIRSGMNPEYLRWLEESRASG
jgi:hypothetical protein